MNADNQVQADRARGIEVVSSPATKEHKEHAGMQENGCAALRNLDLNADNRVTIAQAEAVIPGRRAARTRRLQRHITLKALTYYVVLVHVSVQHS